MSSTCTAPVLRDPRGSRPREGAVSHFGKRAAVSEIFAVEERPNRSFSSGCCTIEPVFAPAFPEMERIGLEDRTINGTARNEANRWRKG